MAQSKVGTINKRPTKTKLFAPAGAPPLKSGKKALKQAPARKVALTKSDAHLDNGSNAFDTKTGKPVRLVKPGFVKRGKRWVPASQVFKPTPHNPAVLVNNRYPIKPLPEGKHKNVEVRVIGGGLYPTVFYRTDDGRIYYNGHHPRDLVIDSGSFGAKEISAVYQLGGPAPKHVKKAREEYVAKQVTNSAERLKPQLLEAAAILGYKSFTTKDGKTVTIPKYSAKRHRARATAPSVI